MQNQKIFTLQLSLFAVLLFIFEFSRAQMVTGVWHGKANRQKVEVKMVQYGDSLTGTAYYFESGSRYRRYSIKGYLDESDNSVVWWDDQLLQDKMKGPNLFSKSKEGSSRADFNCPGGMMMLDGKVYYNEEEKPDGDVHLSKVETAIFRDEWDFVIENYTTGANDRDMIDSISQIAQRPTDKSSETVLEDGSQPAPGPVIKNDEPVEKDLSPGRKEIVSVPVSTPGSKTFFDEKKITAPTIEQKFESRENIFQKEIPVTGDSIELDFYDNAEVDGDSISLFLNGKLIFEHIALTEKAYKIKLSVNDLNDSNELIMVAENLGSIPPNTSYMVALVGDKRYDAQLASTENSSAMIKLEKAVNHER
jgi:hypothetical protein